jgi:cysteinyl-tRNA synthetase
MLAERLQAKMSRNFSIADSIQMDLIDGGVFVHDGMKEWRCDGVPYGSFESGGRGPGATAGSRNAGYTKSPHSGDIEGVEDALIDGLVKERVQMKMVRDYDKADAIREGLRSKFNVLVDDRLRQWSVGGDFGEEHNANRELADKFANRGYVKSNSSLALSPEDEEHVMQQVDERTQAKKERDFQTADDIREHLQERFDISINDKLKLWSAGGAFEEMGGREQTPRGEYTRRGGGQLSEEDVATITETLAERYQAKRDRNFDVADDIRDHLMRTFNVRVDDRSNEWRVDTDDYEMAGQNNLSAEDVEYIDTKLKERFNFKRERYYDEADDIREDLREKFGVSIDDRTKEWSIESVAEYSVAETTNAEDTSDESTEVDEELDDALESMLNTDDDFEEEADEIEVTAEEEEDEEEEDEDAMTEEELTSLTVPSLKEKLKVAGLPVSGKKAELIARLLA